MPHIEYFLYAPGETRPCRQLLGVLPDEVFEQFRLGDVDQRDSETQTRQGTFQTRCPGCFTLYPFHAQPGTPVRVKGSASRSN